MTLPTEAERLARLCKNAGCDCTEERAMPVDLDEVRKRHKRCSGLARCRMPCDAIQLADEVERLRTDISRLRDELAQAWGLTDADTEAARTAEIEGLREALKEIARAVTYSPDEEELVKIAREVLGRKGMKL